MDGNDNLVRSNLHNTKTNRASPLPIGQVANVLLEIRPKPRHENNAVYHPGSRGIINELTRRIRELRAGISEQEAWS